MLFVDPDRSALAREQLNGYAHLLAVAVERSVPIHVSSLGDISSFLEEHLGADLLPNLNVHERSCLNPWSHELLMEAIRSSKRDRLIMAGGWPEGSLAQAALSALFEAFDVYIVFDLCDGLMDAVRSPIADRFLQAGVVPLTKDQLILEWTGHLTVS